LIEGFWRGLPNKYCLYFSPHCQKKKKNNYESSLLWWLGFLVRVLMEAMMNTIFLFVFFFNIFSVPWWMSFAGKDDE
jgi:hypothetical protein